MVIHTRLATIKDFLDMVSKYDELITANNFLDATVVDMKANAKDTCDSAKAELDSIKDEIDEWV